MRLPAAIAIAAAALLLLLPAAAQADPQPLWRSFPLGRQPLIDRQAVPVPAKPATPSTSRGEAAGSHDAARRTRGDDSSVADTLVLVVSGVLAIALLLAMIAVFATPRLVNRRTT